MDSTAATYACTTAFVDELSRAGLQHVCICPGSRSTPLALSFAACSRLRVWMHLDERSAAYFALGLARATGEPAAILCTSGTAAANFYPAVVEAAAASLPLIVLTADRPPELQQLGANQTIDQWNLYGSHARWFVAMPVPDTRADIIGYFRVTASRAIATARAVPPGPVHLNFPFREPLVPPLAAFVTPPGATATFAAASPPTTRIVQGPRQPTPHAIDRLAEAISTARRGLVVGGPRPDAAYAEPLGRLAPRFGLPVLADPLSQLRCGPHDRAAVIERYDAFLRVSGLAAALTPDLIVRCGAFPASKPLLHYLERHAACRQVVIQEGLWNDPTLAASEVIDADPRLLFTALEQRLGSTAPACAPAWLAEWQRLDAAAAKAIDQNIADFTEPFEGRLFPELATLLPEAATLFVGNSMPVRDLDSFLPGRSASLRVMANRGASGIDGVTSTALGVAAAGDGPVILVIGDLSFYHDLNGLLAARRHGISLTVILVNNDGGGIFSFLPQAAYREPFELLFGTPHGLDFQPAVATFGGTFHRPATWPAFRDAVAASLDAAGLSVVEIRTDRERNVARHADVWAAVERAVHDARLEGAQP